MSKFVHFVRRIIIPGSVLLPGRNWRSFEDQPNNATEYVNGVYILHFLT